MKITIELPDDLHKALKSDFAAQVISERFLGLELSASSKVAHLVLEAAQPRVQPTPPTACEFCGHVPAKSNDGLRNPANTAGG